jgi:threonine dehydratase
MIHDAKLLRESIAAAMSAADPSDIAFAMVAAFADRAYNADAADGRELMRQCGEAYAFAASACAASERMFWDGELCKS